MLKFLPVMRSHGTDTPREPWQFGEKGDKYYDTIIRYIRLRYRLIPYFYSLAYQVWKEDAMTMRSLLFDYQEDERAANCLWRRRREAMPIRRDGVIRYIRNRAAGAASLPTPGRR